jgi:hypothetical protein
VKSSGAVAGSQSCRHSTHDFLVGPLPVLFLAGGFDSVTIVGQNDILQSSIALKSNLVTCRCWSRYQPGFRLIANLSVLVVCLCAFSPLRCHNGTESRLESAVFATRGECPIERAFSHGQLVNMLPKAREICIFSKKNALLVRGGGCLHAWRALRKAQERHLPCRRTRF